jgi:CRP-like cAMP-binding protein
MARFDTVVRIPGAAYRMPALEALHAVRQAGPFASSLLRANAAFQTQISFRGSCSLHHTVLQRLASYLLMVRDRLGPAQVPLTHAVLAEALGVGRPSITLNVDQLQKDGIVHVSRGSISVMDWHALGALACECYGDICEAYARLLGQPDGRWADETAHLPGRA